MKLIVDAYNVLKQVSSNLYIADHERAAFVAQMVAYANKKRIEAIIVFDGASGGDYASSEHRGRVTIVYAGPGVQADTFIQKYVHNYKEHELLLVSTDRALCRWVARYNVQSIDALAFYAMLRQTQRVDTSKEQIDGKAIKLGSVADQDIDALMEEAADQVMIKESEDDEPVDRSSGSYTPSKKERALLKKIKKL